MSDEPTTLNSEGWGRNPAEAGAARAGDDHFSDAADAAGDQGHLHAGSPGRSPDAAASRLEEAASFDERLTEAASLEERPPTATPYGGEVDAARGDDVYFDDAANAIDDQGQPHTGSPERSLTTAASNLDEAASLEEWPQSLPAAAGRSGEEQSGVVGARLSEGDRAVEVGGGGSRARPFLPRNNTVSRQEADEMRKLNMLSAPSSHSSAPSGGGGATSSSPPGKVRPGARMSASVYLDTEIGMTSSKPARLGGDSSPSSMRELVHGDNGNSVVASVGTAASGDAPAGAAGIHAPEQQPGQLATVGDAQIDLVDPEKQRLGQRLFVLIRERCPADAAKITGMILELDNTRITQMLEDRATLWALVESAVDTLEEDRSQKTDRTPQEYSSSQGLMPRLDNEQRQHPRLEDHDDTWDLLQGLVSVEEAERNTKIAVERAVRQVAVEAAKDAAVARDLAAVEQAKAVHRAISSREITVQQATKDRAAAVQRAVQVATDEAMAAAAAAAAVAAEQQARAVREAVSMIGSPQYVVTAGGATGADSRTYADRASRRSASLDATDDYSTSTMMFGSTMRQREPLTAKLAAEAEIQRAQKASSPRSSGRQHIEATGGERLLESAMPMAEFDPMDRSSRPSKLEIEVQFVPKETSAKRWLNRFMLLAKRAGYTRQHADTLLLNELYRSIPKTVSDSMEAFGAGTLVATFDWMLRSYPMDMSELMRMANLASSFQYKNGESIGDHCNGMLSQLMEIFEVLTTSELTEEQRRKTMEMLYNSFPRILRTDGAFRQSWRQRWERGKGNDGDFEQLVEAAIEFERFHMAENARDPQSRGLKAPDAGLNSVFGVWGAPVSDSSGKSQAEKEATKRRRDEAKKKAKLTKFGGGGAGNTVKSSRACWECGSTDHIKRDCPAMDN